MRTGTATSMRRTTSAATGRADRAPGTEETAQTKPPGCSGGNVSACLLSVFGTSRGTSSMCPTYRGEIVMAVIRPPRAVGSSARRPRARWPVTPRAPGRGYAARPRCTAARGPAAGDGGRGTRLEVQQGRGVAQRRGVGRHDLVEHPFQRVLGLDLPADVHGPTGLPGRPAGLAGDPEPQFGVPLEAQGAAEPGHRRG